MKGYSHNSGQKDSIRGWGGTAKNKLTIKHDKPCQEITDWLSKSQLTQQETEIELDN